MARPSLRESRLRITGNPPCHGWMRCSSADLWNGCHRATRTHDPRMEGPKERQVLLGPGACLPPMLDEYRSRSNAGHWHQRHRCPAAARVPAISSGSHGRRPSSTSREGSVRAPPQDFVMIVSLTIIIHHRTPGRGQGHQRVTQVHRPNWQITEVRNHFGRPYAAVIHPRTVIVGIGRQD